MPRHAPKDLRCDAFNLRSGSTREIMIEILVTSLYVIRECSKYYRRGMLLHMLAYDWSDAEDMSSDASSWARLNELTMRSSSKL